VENEVEFVVVGAFAMAFYDMPRTTGDIDFFVRATQENARRIANAIRAFGFGHIQVDEEALARPNSFIMLGHPPVRIDVLTGIDGVSFDEVWESRTYGHLGPFRLAFISIEHLIQNKSATGRLKDQADVQRLRKLPGRNST
jgi:hypothetical protein